MPSTFRSSLMLALVVVFTGIGAGLGAMLLALLLHGIQHLAYGYSLDSLVSHETFLWGVTAAAPERRLAVLVACGLVAGLGWWAVYRYGRPLVSIKQAVSEKMPIMPPKTTLAHGFGGEKRIEHFTQMFFADSAATVGNGQVPQLLRLPQSRRH